jgi:hypothetical protein
VRLHGRLRLQGYGDTVEISGGKIVFHVGYSPDSHELKEQAKKNLAAAGHAVPADGMTRMQPPGIPKKGISIKWSLKDGEVHAAGPRAKKQLRPYSSSHGPLKSMPPV